MEHAIETNCLHGGYVPGNGEPRQLPIIQSTTYTYDSCDEMAKLFDLESDGYMYSRLANPTNDMVAKKICALEGGTAAVLTSSGQAATFFSLFNIATCGDHIIASSGIYGGTFNLLNTTFPMMGIEVTFVPVDITAEELDKEFRPNTKAVFGETIANPALTVFDIEMYAEAAHRHGVPLIIDNTFATPYNCRPFEWGCDIVVHSTTKYMEGHGATIGGVVVDSGNFDWMAHADKYPGLTTPDESYHGVVYCEKFGNGMAYIQKLVCHLMRDFGAIQAPQNAYYLNLGLETLHVRMPKHCENGLAVAEFVSKSDKVAAVNYPGLKGDKYYDLAQKYMPNGTCGVVSFELKGGRKAAEQFMSSLKIASVETHVADSVTCCLSPAITTHRQLTDEQLKAAGVPAGLVRFSCGLENTQDLLDDVAQALDAIK